MDNLNKLGRLGERMAVMSATNRALDAKPSGADAFAEFQDQAGVDFTTNVHRRRLNDELLKISVSRAVWLFRAGFDAGFNAAIEGVRQASHQEPHEVVK